MAGFDPYAGQPNWQQQGTDVLSAWQRALANLNFQKTNVMSKYGFNNEGDFSGSGNLNPDGTYKDTNLTGGMAGVTNFSEFAGKDNKSGQGGFRDELNMENDALTAADNAAGSRGFSGGLANQAKTAAQNAVNRSQFQFTQGYNQFAGGFNIAGQNSQADTNQQFGSILQNQTEYKAGEAAWQSSLPKDVVSGISGGGSTPMWTPTQTANALGYQVNSAQLKKQMAGGGTTFKGTAPPARGGHAL